MGDCVFLSYSPNPLSGLVGADISFTCCLSETPPGEQKQGTATLIKATMKTEMRVGNMMQNKSKQKRPQPNLTDHIQCDTCHAKTIASLTHQHSPFKTEWKCYAHTDFCTITDAPCDRRNSLEFTKCLPNRNQAEDTVDSNASRTMSWIRCFSTLIKRCFAAAKSVSDNMRFSSSAFITVSRDTSTS